MTRRQHLLGAILGALGVIGVLAGPAAPAAAAPGALDAPAAARAAVTPAAVAAPAALVAPAAAASVEDFVFSSLEVDYYLSRAEIRDTAELLVVERFVAEFPNRDQNRGIIRSIPNRDGAKSLGLRVVGVTDGEGGDVPYTIDEEAPSDVTRLVIDDDAYKHGPTVYEITYRMSEVARSFADGDEFFPDVNGTEWAQSFERVTARLHVAGETSTAYPDAPDARDPAALDGLLDGRADCLTGTQGARGGACEIAEPVTGAADWPADAASRPATETVVEVTAGPLVPGENLSFVVGFEPGTFARPETAGETVAAHVLALIAAVLAVATLAGMLIVRVRDRLALPRPRIVQYTPPKDVPLRVAAFVLNRPNRLLPSVVTDAAVRGLLEFRTRPGTVRSTDPHDHWLARRVDPSEQGADDEALLRALFGSGPTPKTKIRLDRISRQRGERIEEYRVASRVMAEDLGYVAGRRTGLVAAAVCALVVSGLLAAFVAAFADDGWISWSLAAPTAAVVFVCAVVAFLLRPSAVRLSPAGHELVQYLAGMREYIRIAEAERLRMLQSPTTAEERRVGGLLPSDAVRAGASGSASVPAGAPAEAGGARIGVLAAGCESPELVRLHVYERMLPYAILFKQEKQWARVLAELGAAPEADASNAALVSVAAQGALVHMIVAASAAPPVDGASGSGSDGGAVSSGFSVGGGFSGGGFGGGGGGGR
ncbi:DUF2207 domain-containing protein [Agromyces archimandritae]|uniref:DUF2207 domain-containing protein n=1 Tax=Agromyces archimandritae TaxID=2781962 RepID=A0A975FLI6_9MICO|nr:DUF2207 domain-containing protein [Agromyces archimandritae]QTX03947.1 DUF2207 domain-containing protein [Agromyces archimandritae]